MQVYLLVCNEYINHRKCIYFIFNYAYVCGEVEGEACAHEYKYLHELEENTESLDLDLKAIVNHPLRASKNQALVLRTSKGS